MLGRVNASQARMAWIRDEVDPDDPEATHIVLGIDCGEQADAESRVVAQLLGYAMESDEGVFHLLPQDLCYEATRSGDQVTVELFSMSLADGAKGGAAEWVKVLSATVPFDEDAELPETPLVLIDHEGVVGLDELLETIPEAGVHIVGPRPRPEIR